MWYLSSNFEWTYLCLTEKGPLRPELCKVFRFFRDFEIFDRFLISVHLLFWLKKVSNKTKLKRKKWHKEDRSLDFNASLKKVSDRQIRNVRQREKVRQGRMEKKSSLRIVWRSIQRRWWKGKKMTKKSSILWVGRLLLQIK